MGWGAYRAERDVVAQISTLRLQRLSEAPSKRFELDMVGDILVRDAHP